MSELPPISHPTDSVPLRGYLVKTEGEALWIQDRQGVWIVGKSDIVAEGHWAGTDPRFGGKPICVYIRNGAEIREVRPTRIQIAARPITLNDPLIFPRIEGLEDFRKLERKWVRHLGFQPWEGDEAGTCSTSKSCSETGTWGVDCGDDDSTED